VKPFLLLATRAEDAAADNEYASFCRFTGLDPSQLVRHRWERKPLDGLDLDDYSGIFMGGSPFTTSDPDDLKSPAQRRVERELWPLLRAVLDRDFPLLGACYGIGTLGVHLGGVVDRTYGEPIGPVPVTTTVEGAADPVFGSLPTRFEAFVGHKEAITALPAEAVLLAGSPACPVQAFRVGRNVYATQFHPELDVEGLCTRIEVYKYAGYFEPAEAEVIKLVARRAAVHAPPRLLRRFVEVHARP
jgi:GMP synthase (glutamine-hydrolysing)